MYSQSLTVISHRLQGYCEDLQATANCFAGDFYLTGDRGVQDEVNQLHSSWLIEELVIGWVFLVLFPH